MIEQQLRDMIIGESAVIRRVRDLVMRVGPSRLPVLIQGPTGAGKELVARGLHLTSGRTGDFVACNVCALNEGLFESAFFGHVRGAFTGALNSFSGHLADADGGTMFLDEMGGLPLGCQPKLLRALDEKTFRPVGATRDRRSDFRVVAAANEDLAALVASGRFRVDLFHRVAGITIRVPSLAARPGDVPLLADYFVQKIARMMGSKMSMSAAAAAVLRQHSWAGNVRELSLAVERATLFARDGVIDVHDVQAAIGSARPVSFSSPHLVERERVVTALRNTHGDTRAAARLLGVSRPTVYRYMSLFGLSARAVRASGFEQASDTVPRPDRATDSSDSHDSHAFLENSHENGGGVVKQIRS